jgi:hypothetical protein
MEKPLVPYVRLSKWWNTARCGCFTLGWFVTLHWFQETLVLITPHFLQ